MFASNSTPLLKNRYQVLHPIQAGGLGQTYLATDTQVPGNRRCVMKRLQPNISPNDAQLYEQGYTLALSQFEKEAETLSKLKHDQIPALYDYFEEQGEMYLVQEWIEGPTLGEVVRQSGPLRSEQVETILLALLPVLNYLQQKKVIHRDIKPENIMVRQEDGQPVLIDFGSVKHTLQTVLHRSGVPCSVTTLSEGFSPPEQVAGRPINYSSDLYSLGMTTIYLLTAMLPQEMEVSAETGYVLWRNHVPAVSPKLAAIVDRAIQFNPVDRYSYSSEMLQALHSSYVAPPVTLPATQLSNPPQPIPSPQHPSADAMTADAMARPGARPTPVPTQLSDNSGGTIPPIPQAVQPYGPNHGRNPWRPKRLGIAAGISAVVVGGMAGALGYSQWDTYRQDQAQRQDIEEFRDQGNYHQCQQTALAVNSSSRVYNSVQTLLDQCRLDEAQALADLSQYGAAIAKANEVTDRDTDTRDQAKDLITSWSGQLDGSVPEDGGNGQLQEAKQLRDQGDVKGAVMAALGVAPQSVAAGEAQMLVAELTQVDLGAKLDQELKPLNVPKRSLQYLDGSMAAGPANAVETVFGETPIRADREQWPDYRKTQGALNGGQNFDGLWEDAWLEMYEVVPDKMHLGVLYGCMVNETIQTEAHFGPTVDLGFVETKLSHMLDGEFNPEISEKLTQVYDGANPSDQVFQTERFKGLIRSTDHDQILIVLREV